MKRREFIKTLALSGAAVIGPSLLGELFIPFVEAADIPKFSFAHITDLQKQKDLNPAITAVEMGGALAVGTHYKIRMNLAGREFVTENEIVALEPNKIFGVKTLAAPPAAPKA